MRESENVASADSLREAHFVLTPDPRTHRAETLADLQQRIAQYQLADSVPHAIRVHFETAKNLYLYAWFVYRFYPVAEKHVLTTLEFALRERLSAWLRGRDGPEARVPRGLSKLIAMAAAERLITNDGLRANERLARKRAEHRVSTERFREMQARGFAEMVVEDAPIEPLPEDYAYDSLKIFEQSLPFIRNGYAHGTAMLHATVLGTFEDVTDLVNQLFSLDANEGS